MTQDVVLNNWERQQYQHFDYQPEVAYFVLGADPQSLKLNRSQYRTEGVPAGVSVDVYDTEGVFAILDQSGLLNSLQKNQPDLIQAMNSRSGCTLIKGRIEHYESLNYLRDIVGLIACLLDQGGVGVYDVVTGECWTAAEWKEKFFASDKLDVFAHVGILAIRNPENQTLELKTIGMRKVGRFDLWVENVAPELAETMVEMLNRLIGYQAHGGLIPEGQPISMEGLPEGLTCQYSETSESEELGVIYIVQSGIVA